MKFLLVAACFVLTGCARHAVRVDVPGHCFSIRVRDFTEPCLVEKDGSLLCDKVRVSAKCVSFRVRP